MARLEMTRIVFRGGSASALRYRDTVFLELTADGFQARAVLDEEEAVRLARSLLRAVREARAARAGLPRPRRPLAIKRV